jgi:hypothetical protein
LRQRIEVFEWQGAEEHCNPLATSILCEEMTVLEVEELLISDEQTKKQSFEEYLKEMQQWKKTLLA